MSVLNQLVNVKINSVSDTGQVNIGNAINVNPVDQDVSVGGSGGIGDFSANAHAANNEYFDPDIYSQTQFKFF
ncbi:spore germination protein [Risungbinella massiliensis]|uniref:spore germination protein n=1 Tax=Risungbinella massiliensis TaxID=1329796 RepID=UPI0005CBDA61|nr:spore germination protein [Risungbinella massiliensis]